MISKEILNENKFKDIKIKNGQLLIKTLNDSEDINEYEKINIKTEDGKIYLENTAWNKLMMIPIEDKVYINTVNIKNNLINIFANSPISF